MKLIFKTPPCRDTQLVLHPFKAIFSNGNHCVVRPNRVVVHNAVHAATKHGIKKCLKKNIQRGNDKIWIWIWTPHKWIIFVHLLKCCLALHTKNEVEVVVYLKRSARKSYLGYPIFEYKIYPPWQRETDPSRRTSPC